jgi:hypothetical protein
VTRARWTAWTPDTPRGPGWSGQDAKGGQHGPD